MLYMTKTDAGTLSANRHDDHCGKGLNFGFYASESFAFFECDKKTNKVRLVILDSVAKMEDVEVMHVKDMHEYNKVVCG
jgi:hypothetical protein